MDREIKTNIGKLIEQAIANGYGHDSDMALILVCSGEGEVFPSLKRAMACFNREIDCEDDVLCVSIAELFLDVNFWKAIYQEGDNWKKQWHAFIEHLAKDKTIEEWLEWTICNGMQPNK